MDKSQKSNATFPTETSVSYLGLFFHTAGVFQGSVFFFSGSVRWEISLVSIQKTIHFQVRTMLLSGKVTQRPTTYPSISEGHKLRPSMRHASPTWVPSTSGCDAEKWRAWKFHAKGTSADGNPPGTASPLTTKLHAGGLLTLLFII